THHGVFDLSFLLTLPGATIYNPRSIRELVSVLKCIVTDRWPSEGPVFIRYPKKAEELTEEHVRDWIEELETDDVLRWGTVAQQLDSDQEGRTPETLLFSTGAITQTAIAAAPALGTSYRVIDAIRAKPLDWETIDLFFSSSSSKRVVTIEEGTTVGGFGQYLTLELLRRYGDRIEGFLNIGLPDAFIEHGKNEHLYRRYGLDVDGLAAQFRVFSKKMDTDPSGSLAGLWGDRR
ncbi:MAG TPA: transketolase C-terminal domain-containing protein, partial [Thermotogota bacterium]|nr:transketolase C-terminal domain-containing protein [Thermotogota bacterium]